MNATDKCCRLVGLLLAWTVLTFWGAASAREPFSAERSPIRLSPVPPVPNYGYYSTHWRRWPDDNPVRKRRKDRERPTAAEPSPSETAPGAELESLPDEPPTTPGGPPGTIPPEESLFPPDEPLPPLSPGAAPGPSTPDTLLPPSEPMPTSPPTSPPTTTPSSPSDSLFPPEDTPGEGGLLLPPATPSGPSTPSGPMSSRGRRPGSPSVAQRAPGGTRRTGAATSRGWRPSGGEPGLLPEASTVDAAPESAGPTLAGPRNHATGADSGSSDATRWRRPSRSGSGGAPVGAEPDRFRPTTPLRPTTSRATRTPNVGAPLDASGGIVTAAYTSTSASAEGVTPDATVAGEPSHAAPSAGADGNPLRHASADGGSMPQAANPLRAGR